MSRETTDEPGLVTSQVEGSRDARDVAVRRKTWVPGARRLSSPYKSTVRRTYRRTSTLRTWYDRDRGPSDVSGVDAGGPVVPRRSRSTLNGTRTPPVVCEELGCDTRLPLGDWGRPSAREVVETSVEGFHGPPLWEGPPDPLSDLRTS